jgi:hypothetical protein
VNLYSRVYERERLVALLRSLGRRSRRLLWGGAFVGLYDWAEEEGGDMRRHCREIDICNSLTQVWLHFTVLAVLRDPGCLSRIPDPDFYPSRIQKQQQKRGVKKISCHTFFVALNFTKLKIILFLKC